MNIINATYGGVDCTQIVESKVINETLIMTADNNIIGDVLPGVVKNLVIEYNHEGYVGAETFKEGETFILPKSKNDRLGIFYSNNNNRMIRPAILASLKSIKNAANGKVDILTCMWNHEPENPFYEVLSWYKSSSHLNQLLQIMQLLYIAKKIGNYKYVSFLEHDVLYGEGYFDYPNFKNQIMCNMNYNGINNYGFQPLIQTDKPFHQMTMEFDAAITHCEKILANALVTNSGNIESNEERAIWYSKNTSLHINHGYHFTSHYNVYDKVNTYKHHSYWGNHSDYLGLFIT